MNMLSDTRIYIAIVFFAVTNLISSAFAQGWTSLSDERGINPYAESYASKEDSVRASWFWYEEGRRQQACKGDSLKTAIESYSRTLDLNPLNIDAAMNKAKLLVRSGKYSTAQACLNQSLQVNPDSIELWKSMIKSVPYLSGYFEVLSTAHRNIIRLDSGNIESYKALIELYEDNDYFDEEIELYRIVHRRFPTEMWAWKNLADLLCWRLNRCKEGLAYFDTAAMLDPTNQWVKAWRANAMLENGMPEDGSNEWDSIVASPDLSSNSRADYMHGEFLLFAGHYEKAEEVLLQSVRKNPDTALWAWFYICLARNGLEQPLEKQLEAVNNAISLGDTDPNCDVARFAILYGLGRKDEAIAVYDQIMASWQFSINSLDKKSSDPLRDDRFRAVYSMTDKFLTGFCKNDKRPVNTLMNEILAKAYERLGNDYIAILLADKCINDGIATDHSWQVKGRILRRKNRLTESEEAFRQAIAINENGYENWYGLASAQLSQTKYIEALASAKIVLQLNEKQVRGWELLGNVQLALGRQDDAFESFAKAVSLDERNSQTYYNRARAYCKLELIRMATHDIQRAIYYNPAYRDSARADSAFSILASDVIFRSIVDTDSPVIK
ncbi:MAG: tetratricopeptide repeat protein [Calditrichota bacterium]